MIRNERSLSPTSSIGGVGQRTEESPATPSTILVKDAASPSIWRRIKHGILYTPQRCRYDPAKPPGFSLFLNLLFSFAGAFTVANLYYNHPILNILARDFGVTDERASLIPTLAQAGYAADTIVLSVTTEKKEANRLPSPGLLFLCPLGDIFRRRGFILALVLFTATFWIGLCITTSFPVFGVLTFITSVTTVTPQLMLPLVGQLAPAHRRATALSIVVSGLLLGLLVARVLSGVVTNFTSWRNIYWLSCGLQYFIFVMLWAFMPDYPSTNPDGIKYFRVLWSIVTIVFHEPVLVQACMTGAFASMTFTSFWTTLTFLLAGPPYSYTPLTIGLFALIGILGLFFGPPYSRFVIDKFVPLFSVIVGEFICLIGIVIGTYMGQHSVAGPIIQAFLLDVGIQTAQIANRSAIYTIAPKARNRINTAFMVCIFAGQLTGTAVGNTLYARGGWTRSGSASIGFICVSLLSCFIKGPWEKGWIGWRGGWSLRRRDLGPKASGQEDTADTADVELAEGQDQAGAVELDAVVDGGNRREISATVNDGPRNDEWLPKKQTAREAGYV